MKRKIARWWWWRTPLIPELQRQRQTQRQVNLWLGWSTELVHDNQLYRETLSTKIKNIKSVCA